MKPITPASVVREKDLISAQPLAGAEEIVDLGVQPVPGLFFPSAAAAAGARSRVRLVRAPGSGLFQLDRDLNPELYYYYKSGRVTPAHLEHVERTAAALARTFPADARILEIGGGAGHLMQALRRHGFSRLFIVDPSAENVAGQGYEGIRGLFPDALTGDGRRFDVIIGQHFLEHSAQPVAVLRAAAERLTERGQVWIEVPDIEGSALAANGEHLSIIYALHSAYYDRGTLAVAGAAAGLELVGVAPVDHYGKSIQAVFARSRAGGVKAPHPGADHAAVTAAIRNYFQELAAFGRNLPAGLLCWGAAERCLTVLGACMAGGFRPGMICDSNPDLRGLYLPGMDQPVRGPDEVAGPIAAALMLSVRNAADIVAANRARFTPDADIYIPFAGRRKITQLLS